MQSHLKHFYSDKKILITGHTTFIGSWLAMMLHQLGAKLTGCSIKPPSNPNLYDEADIHELIDSHIGDVRNYEFFNEIVRNEQPELVIHLSSIFGFCNSIEPNELYAINMLGTLNALEVCRQSESVRVFINLVPDYSNGLLLKNCDKKNQGELDLVMGSFRSTEFLTSGYRNAYFDAASYAQHHKSIVNVKILPPLGGGDWSKNNLIQDYITVLLKGKKEIVARPTKTISTIHVLDVLSGLLNNVFKLHHDAADNLHDRMIFPDGAHLKDEQWIAETFASIWGSGKVSVKNVQGSSTDKNSADKNELIMQGYADMPDWTPGWDAVTALRKTVEWHQARERGANMQRFSMGQVEEYLNK